MYSSRSFQHEHAGSSFFARLKEDNSGAFRDSLTQDLRAAEDELHASLSISTSESEALAIRELIEAINLAISESSEVWVTLRVASAGQAVIKRA